MSVDPIDNLSTNYGIQGQNNPYRIANPNIIANPQKIHEDKLAPSNQKQLVARSPYGNISQTISKTMGELSGDQRSYILEQYTRTDAILDELGYYR